MRFDHLPTSPPHPNETLELATCRVELGDKSCHCGYRFKVDEVDFKTKFSFMEVQWSPLNKTTLGRGLSGFINRLVLLTDVSNFISLRFQCIK